MFSTCAAAHLHTRLVVFGGVRINQRQKNHCSFSWSMMTNGRILDLDLELDLD